MENLPKRKRGRTKVKDIDPELVYKLASMHCTLREIAKICDVDQETIRRHFGEEIEQAKAIGARSLRRAQWDKALSGSDRMLIFLGKNYLGQQETPDNGEENTPLPWDED